MVGSCSFEAFTPAEGAFYEIRCSSSVNIRKMRFQLVGYAREVCLDGIRLNVMGSPHDIEGEGVVCRFDREIVKKNEI